MADPHQRRRGPPSGRRSDRVLYRQARDGELPAEALPTRLRWRLVAELHAAGWSDSEIAEWTLESSYTVARIREGMGLKPNPNPERKGGEVSYGPAE